MSDATMTPISPDDPTDIIPDPTLCALCGEEVGGGCRCDEPEAEPAIDPGDPNRVTLYTVSPACYDGFSCRELSPDCGTDNRGETVRKVSVERRDLEWQFSRYNSGLYGVATEDEARRFPTIWRLREGSETR